MLERLFVDNYRCFVNFEYKPQTKQLLMGANGSGKSTVLEVLRALKRFIQGGCCPFTQSSRTRWLDLPLQVFEVQAAIEGRDFSYRLEIGYSPASKTPFVSLERLEVDRSPVFEFVNGEMRSFVGGSDQRFVLRDDWRESTLHLAVFGNPDVHRFVEWMDTIHCFKIDAYEEKMDEVADAEDSVPDYELENLAGWYLHQLAADPDAVDGFRSAMKDVLANFARIRFDPEYDGAKKLLIDFVTKSNGLISLSLHELSDGQRCLIALYMILNFLIMKGHTVFLDEPDNFISLREIQPWLLAAEQAAEDHHAQLILISHHPELLNQWAKDYGLLFQREANDFAVTKAFGRDSEGYLQPSEVIARGWEHE